VPIAAFFDQVAAPTPTPGGGTVAAFVGALATCLATMVANLTLGKKKYAASEAAMTGVKREADALRGELLALARRDSEAFDAVLRARRMPETTAAEREAREQALAAATLEACHVPLQTARACARVGALAAAAASQGNVNAVTDAGAGGLLARAAGEAALLNVDINLKTLAGTADKDSVSSQAAAVRAELHVATDRCAVAVASAMSA